MYCGPKQSLKLDRRLRYFEADTSDLPNQHKEYSRPVPPFTWVKQITIEPESCLEVEELFPQRSILVSIKQKTG